MDEIDDNPGTDTTGGDSEQGELFDSPRTEPVVPSRIDILDPLDPFRIIETFDIFDPELAACVERPHRRHRRRRGETVKVQIRASDSLRDVKVETRPGDWPEVSAVEIRPGEWVDGVVLSEGFDVYRRHVGWVGIPGTAVVRRQLCGLAHGDDAALAQARERADAAGLVVWVGVW